MRNKHQEKALQIAGRLCHADTAFLDELYGLILIPDRAVVVAFMLSGFMRNTLTQFPGNRQQAKDAYAGASQSTSFSRMASEEMHYSLRKGYATSDLLPRQLASWQQSPRL